ncbi:MAG: hypothetical protein ABW148_01875 [Sedimenticola sp.]
MLRKLMFGSLVAVMLHVGATSAAQVVIDRAVRAGDLTLFPAVDKPNEFYYVADKLQLDRRENNKPVFSFLRYVNPAISESDGRSAGGAVLHAVVKLGVPEDVLDDARQALSQVVPGGVLKGPVNFKSGTFSLVSSFADEQGDFTDKLVGTGKAPIFEGEKAAVSLRLTNKGADILMESFRRTAPDISFSFEMEMDGYLAPKQALLEANFDTIYKHKAFKAGVATPYLQAEIDTAFDDLQRSGAIKLTQVGSDEEMNKLISAAYEKISAMMFDKAETNGGTAIKALTSSTSSSADLLDKASKLLTASRTEVRKDNEAIEKRNDTQAVKNSAAAEARVSFERQNAKYENHKKRAANESARAQRYRDRIAELKASIKPNDPPATLATPTVGAGVAGESLVTAVPSDPPVDPNEATKKTIVSLEAEVAKSEKRAADFNSSADELSPQVAEADKKRAATAEYEKDLEEVESLPSISVVASYKMKKSRVRGDFKIDLNKYTVATQKLRFDENIGDLSAYLDDEDLFKTFDITNSGVARNDVIVSLDGLEGRDFGEFVNTVSVVLRKRHENGEFTLRDLRIDKSGFSNNANKFVLSYNRLDDRNSQKWLDFDYKVNWNFFGGTAVNQEWISETGNSIVLAPPYRRYTVEMEGDPDLIKEKGVRLVTVKLFYKTGGEERVREVKLRPKGDAGMSTTADLVLPTDETGYAYQINWRMAGGKSLSSGRIETTDSVIFIDEFPEG